MVTGNTAKLAKILVNQLLKAFDPGKTFPSRIIGAVINDISVSKNACISFHISFIYEITIAIVTIKPIINPIPAKPRNSEMAEDNTLGPPRIKLITPVGAAIVVPAQVLTKTDKILPH